MGIVRVVRTESPDSKEESGNTRSGHTSRSGKTVTTQATRGDSGARAFPGVGLTLSTSPGPQPVADAFGTPGGPV